MALKFIDGFDHYAAGDVLLKWNGGSLNSMQTGRSGSGQCGRINNGQVFLSKILPAQGTWILGCAMRFSFFPSAGNTVSIMGFDSGASNQVTIKISSTGQIQVFRNTTSLGDSGANLLVANVFQYIEVKVVISTTVGSVEVHVNGATWCNLTGKNTDTASSGTATTIKVGLLDFLNTQITDMDDLYICDGTGSINNTFIGDVAVQTLYPSAAGDLTQWTPSTGSNYQNVDDTTLNKDTDYNSDATAGHEDLYNYTNLTGTIGSIVGVQKVIATRKDDAGTRTVKSITKSGGTVYEGAAVSVLDSYIFVTEVMELDPATSAAWTETNVDAAQFGIKLES